MKQRLLGLFIYFVGVLFGESTFVLVLSIVSAVVLCCAVPWEVPGTERGGGGLKSGCGGVFDTMDLRIDM